MSDLPESVALADRKLSEMMTENAHIKRLKEQIKKSEARVAVLKNEFDVLVESGVVT